MQQKTESAAADDDLVSVDGVQEDQWMSIIHENAELIAGLVANEQTRREPLYIDDSGRIQRVDFCVVMHNNAWLHFDRAQKRLVIDVNPAVSGAPWVVTDSQGIVAWNSMSMEVLVSTLYRLRQQLAWVAEDNGSSSSEPMSDNDVYRHEIERIFGADTVARLLNAEKRFGSTHPAFQLWVNAYGRLLQYASERVRALAIKHQAPPPPADTGDDAPASEEAERKAAAGALNYNTDSPDDDNEPLVTGDADDERQRACIVS